MSQKKKQTTRFQKVAYGITITIAIIAISLILLNEPIIINLGLNKISDINFENNYFKLDAILINNYRDSIVFPDDKLTIKATLTNKWDREMNYFPTIKVLQGEKMIQGPFQLQNYTLAPNAGWTFFQQTFFVGDESTKRLQIIIEGFDVETGDQIITKDIEVELSILSLSNKIQSDQVNTLSMGVIAASVIGGGTLTALYFNQRTSKEEIKKLDKQNKLSEKQIGLLQKQNQDLKEQTSIQNRPWVSLISEHPVTIQGDFFQIQFENYGKSIATNIIVMSMIKKGKITKEELIEKSTSYPEFDLSPQEKFAHMLSIPNDILDVIDTVSDIHIGIILQYKFEETKEGESLLIANWMPAIQKAYYEIKKLR